MPAAPHQNLPANRIETSACRMPALSALSAENRCGSWLISLSRRESSVRLVFASYNLQYVKKIKPKVKTSTVRTFCNDPGRKIIPGMKVCDRLQADANISSPTNRILRSQDAHAPEGANSNRFCAASRFNKAEIFLKKSSPMTGYVIPE